MSFKDIAYLELWQPLCSVDWNHLCNTGRRHEEQPCDFFELGPVAQEEMSYKGISYLERFGLAEHNHLCNFRRGYQDKKFCEIISN